MMRLSGDLDVDRVRIEREISRLRARGVIANCIASYRAAVCCLGSSRNASEAISNHSGGEFGERSA